MKIVNISKQLSEDIFKNLDESVAAAKRECPDMDNYFLIASSKFGSFSYYQMRDANKLFGIVFRSLIRAEMDRENGEGF